MSGWGNQWISNCDEAPGSFPVSSRYQPPLEERWGCRHSFPGEAGQSPSSEREAGKKGFFLTCGGKLSVPLELGRVSLETSGVL